MFRFFRSKPKPDAAQAPPSAPKSQALQAPAGPEVSAEVAAQPRQSWLSKLKAGLRKTGSSIATVFTGTQIDDALYEELETA
jgi:fused signal recognition particle receptor